jgi:hypothetical protein
MSITPDLPQREQVMDPTAQAASTMAATDTREQQMPSTESHRGRNRAYVAGCLVAAIVAAVGGVVLLTGGDDTPETAPTTPPAPVTSSPAPSPTLSVPPKPEDIAAAAAEAKYLEYLQVTREVAQAGYVDLAPFDTIAIDPQTAVLLLTAERGAGIVTTGDTEVVSLTVQSVKLDPPGEYPSVSLLACLDVSGVTAVDAATGESVVSPDRPDRLKSEAVVRNIPPGVFTDGRQPGWYVAEVVQRGEPC